MQHSQSTVPGASGSGYGSQSSQRPEWLFGARQPSSGRERLNSIRHCAESVAPNPRPEGVVDPQRLARTAVPIVTPVQHGRAEGTVARLIESRGSNTPGEVPDVSVPCLPSRKRLKPGDDNHRENLPSYAYEYDDCVSMAERNPDLDAPLPRVPRLPVPVEQPAVQAGVLTNLREAATTDDHAVQPGVDLTKIQRRRGMIPDTRRGIPPYDIETYIETGRGLDLLDARRFEAMPAGEGATVALRVRDGENRVNTRSEGWRTRWKHWTNIPKNYPLHVRCDLLWARQPQEKEYVVEMYDVLTRVRNGSLRIENEGDWESRCRGKFEDLYWIGSRYGWAGDCLMEQRVRRPDRSTLTPRRSMAVFAGWHNLEVWHVRIDLWAQFWVEVPDWWFNRYEGSPLLRVPTPWLFSYFTSWIKSLSNNVDAMKSIWCIAVQEFAVFTLAAFLEAAEHGIERHETKDPGVCRKRDAYMGVLLPIPDRIRACFTPESLVRVLSERVDDVEGALHAYMHSATMDWDAVGAGGNRGRSGPYLYYDWARGAVDSVPGREIRLPRLGADYRALRGQYEVVRLAAMAPVRKQGQIAWSRAEVVTFVNETLGRGADSPDVDMVVPEPGGPTAEYEADWEGEAMDEYDEADDFDHYYELGRSLDATCRRFEMFTPLASRMDEFIQRHRIASDDAARYNREGVALRGQVTVLTAERDRLQADLTVAQERSTRARRAEIASTARLVTLESERDAARADFVGVIRRLRQFRRWLLDGMPALVTIFDRITGLTDEPAAPANVPRLSLGTSGE